LQHGERLRNHLDRIVSNLPAERSDSAHALHGADSAPCAIHIPRIIDPGNVPIMKSNATVTVQRRFLGRIVLASAVLFSGAAMFTGSARAADETPDALVQRISGDVLATIKADKSIKAGDIGKIMVLVDSKIMPNVNFQRMTASAVGPAWRTATPEQQKRLQEEFKTLLVRTYAGALDQVSDQSVTVLVAHLVEGTGIGAHRDPWRWRSRAARLPAREDPGRGRRLEGLQPERPGRMAGRHLPHPVLAADQQQGHRRSDRRPGLAQQEQRKQLR
jgi:hypothetical protein